MTMTAVPAATAEDGTLTTEFLLTLYRNMVTIRRFEEAVYDVYSRGIMPGLAHLYTGMEAIAAGVCANLRPPDNITSTNRGHGHLLAKGADPRRMFSELLGKASGYNKGKGGSMHIADMSLGMLGANGVVGGGLGIATGAGLSAKVLGQDRVSVALFGTERLNEGLFYEAANMAALWEKLACGLRGPENNGDGEYTASDRSTSGTGPARAEAMGIPARPVDGNDVLSVYRAAAWAVGFARLRPGSTRSSSAIRIAGEGTTWVTKATLRVSQPGQIETWMQKCPIRRFRSYLLGAGICHRTRAGCDRCRSAGRDRRSDRIAKQAPYPGPACEVATDVYA